MLGGLVQAPSRLAPNRNLPAAQARAAQVLAAMQELGFASAQDVKVALAQPARPANARGGGSANYVADLVMDVLDDYVGKFDTDITVQTTVDTGLQAAAERRSTEELNAKGAQLQRRPGRPGVDAARRGDPRADRRPRLRRRASSTAPPPPSASPAPRSSPSSTSPPWSTGVTPDTVREDAPIRIGTWAPENYSHRYEGPVTLRTALAQSLNTVAVRLGQEVGPKAVVQTAQRLGITSPLQANGSIALGTSEVTLLEMVGAYAAFANGGIGVMPYVVDGGEGRPTARCSTGGRQRARPGHQRRCGRHDERDDARDLRVRHRQEGRHPGLGSRRARAAPPRITATPGSSASRAAS